MKPKDKVRGWVGHEIGEKNRKAVETYFRTHLCATGDECAKALCLSPRAVSKHVRAIRETWTKKP
jgi:hypothetical protein